MQWKLNAKTQRCRGAKEKGENGTQTNAHHLVTRIGSANFFLAPLQPCDFALKSLRLTEWKRLSPFKTKIMKLQLALLALLAAGLSNGYAAPDSASAASTNRVLVIDPSSMAVVAGKATLTIDTLERVNGVYSGSYKIKVSPYFFKSEKGRLAIIVSDEALSRLNRGEAAAVVGTATTSGKAGRTRKVEATATPSDLNHGTLRLWFMAGERKMIFEPGYHFSETTTAAVPAQTEKTNVAANLQSNPPVSPP
jgi:hypothetical protein